MKNLVEKPLTSLRTGLSQNDAKRKEEEKAKEQNDPTIEFDLIHSHSYVNMCRRVNFVESSSSLSASSASSSSSKDAFYPVRNSLLMNPKALNLDDDSDDENDLDSLVNDPSSSSSTSSSSNGDLSGSDPATPARKSNSSSFLNTPKATPATPKTNTFLTPRKTGLLPTAAPLSTGRVRLQSHLLNKITVSNPEYSTKPSIDELRAMDPQRLASVPNFSVTRDKKGTVEWLEPVDLRGIDDICRFVNFDDDSRFVDVYPNLRAPPVGSQLNHPARISLNLSARKKKPSAEALKRTTESFGGSFVSFDKNIWKFEVQNFNSE